MTELIEWLRAQLDDDERLAKATMTWSADGRWSTDESNKGPQVRVGDEDNVWTRTVPSGVWLCDDPDDDCGSLRAVWYAESEHIVRHDPARVLRQVEATRRILDLHEPVILRKGGGADYYVTVRVCRSCGGTDAWFPDGTPAPARAAAYPCPTLRLLALPCADRLGYREEWRP